MVIPTRDSGNINENNKPVSLGETGESIVSGSQLSPGYWDDNSNKKSFKKTSINKDIPNIFYHSGDLPKLKQMVYITLLEEKIAKSKFKVSE